MCSYDSQAPLLEFWLVLFFRLVGLSLITQSTCRISTNLSLFLSFSHKLSPTSKPDTTSSLSLSSILNLSPFSFFPIVLVVFIITSTGLKILFNAFMHTHSTHLLFLYPFSDFILHSKILFRVWEETVFLFDLRKESSVRQWLESQINIK